MALNFRHSARGAPATVDELGRLLQNVVQAVPQVHAAAPSRAVASAGCQAYRKLRRQRCSLLVDLLVHRSVEFIDLDLALWLINRFTMCLI